MELTTIPCSLILSLAVCWQPQESNENKPATFDEAAETAAIRKAF